MDINRILALLKMFQSVKKTTESFNDTVADSNSVLIQIIKKFNQLIGMTITDNESYSDYFKNINNTIDIAEKNDTKISINTCNDWVCSYEDVIAVSLMSVMSRELDDESKSTIAEFCVNSETNAEIKSAILMSVSEMLSNTDPKAAYEYGIKAFELNPDVAKIFEVDKSFNINEIVNEYHNLCPVCSSSDVIPFKKINQFYVVGNQKCFHPIKLWMKCNNCENLFAYNFPVADMGKINGHYTRNSSADSITPRHCLSVYTDIFNKCNHYTDGKKYLEIGIGNGEMLAAALEFGYDVSAIEICKEDCEKISAVLDVNIMWTDFLDAEIKEKYDVIIMGDVLEHVSRPYDALIKARDLLNVNGVLWLSTPNYESGFTRLMKDNDPMWNQLNHFTYFSYKGIIKILDKLDMKVVRYDASCRYNGSMELFIKKNG